MCQNGFVNVPRLVTFNYELHESCEILYFFYSNSTIWHKSQVVCITEYYCWPFNISIVKKISQTLNI